MDITALVAFNVVVGIASLVLITIGLSLIYGMMKIINLAHGEFMMLGAYAVWFATENGLSFWTSLFVVAPLFVGLVGLLVERIVVRFLYGRMIDTMLATWGVSLAIVGIVTIVFGNNVRGVSSPLGSFSIGAFEASHHGTLLIALALAALAGLWLVFRRTSVGLVVRATMQAPHMAAAMGVNPAKVYMGTFTAGAALAGLAGGALAPLSGIAPAMGGVYIVKAFIAVLCGGEAVITGTALAATLFGPVNEIVSFAATPVIGEVALLISAIVLIRVLPNGITGHFGRRGI